MEKPPGTVMLVVDDKKWKKFWQWLKRKFKG